MALRPGLVLYDGRCLNSASLCCASFLRCSFPCSLTPTLSLHIDTVTPTVDYQPTSLHRSRSQQEVRIGSVHQRRPPRQRGYWHRRQALRAPAAAVAGRPGGGAVRPLAGLLPGLAGAAGALPVRRRAGAICAVRLSGALHARCRRRPGEAPRQRCRHKSNKACRWPCRPACGSAALLAASLVLPAGACFGWMHSCGLILARGRSPIRIFGVLCSLLLACAY